ncbi:hypothetical protein ACHAXN_009688 [Cyclotella atomus]
MTRHRSNTAGKEGVKLERRIKKGLAALLLLLDEWDETEDGLLETLLRKRLETTTMKKDAAKNRKLRQRTSWSRFQSRLTDKQFRRYFRMERECFEHLCQQIIANVGEGAFKSEEYLHELKHGYVGIDIKNTNIANAHEHSTGGFVSGEVKLALTLRLLAGGSYMDLALLFDVGFSTAYEILHHVIKEWILDDRLVKINGIEFCEDEVCMGNVAREFAKKSNFIINGCIGAIDGWIVKIKKPSRNKDLFNLFKNSKFYKWLEHNWKKLAEQQFYFIGDSAYALKSFLMTPFDNAVHGTPEDNYNFFHSSSRIWVECVFGEIDLRWGILWKPLGFRLKHNVNIIDACMRLHNFIVDWREGEHFKSSEVDERTIFFEDHRRFMAAYPDLEVVGVHGGEEEERRNRGRPTNVDKAIRDLGLSVRQSLCDDVAARKLVRPELNWFRRENNRVLDV